LDINELQDHQLSFALPIALELNGGDANGAGRGFVDGGAKKSVGKGDMENELAGKDGEGDLRVVNNKDIEDEMMGLSWDKFKSKTIDRYEKYLPKEVAQELQDALL
jgi:hypothetical protein